MRLGALTPTERNDVGLVGLHIPCWRWSSGSQSDEAEIARLVLDADVVTLRMEGALFANLAPLRHVSGMGGRGLSEHDRKGGAAPHIRLPAHHHPCYESAMPSCSTIAPPMLTMLTCRPCR